MSTNLRSSDLLSRGVMERWPEGSAGDQHVTNTKAGDIGASETFFPFFPFFQFFLWEQLGANICFGICGAYFKIKRNTICSLIFTKPFIGVSMAFHLSSLSYDYAWLRRLVLRLCIKKITIYCFLFHFLFRVFHWQLASLTVLHFTNNNTAITRNNGSEW